MAMVATPFMAWSDTWKVGNETIDAQHKNLVSLVNQLHEAMKSGQGSRALGDILAKLVTYTKTHFATEEQLMQIHKYPDFAKHKVEHEKLTAKVVEFQQAFVDGTAALTIDVLDFLSKWLQGHILGTDMKYVPFLRS